MEAMPASREGLAVVVDQLAAQFGGEDLGECHHLGERAAGVAPTCGKSSAKREARVGVGARSPRDLRAGGR